MPVVCVIRACCAPTLPPPDLVTQLLWWCPAAQAAETELRAARKAVAELDAAATQARGEAAGYARQVRKVAVGICVRFLSKLILRLVIMLMILLMGHELLPGLL